MNDATDVIEIDLYGTLDDTSGFEWSRHSDGRPVDRTTVERPVLLRVELGEGDEVTSTSHLTFVDQHDDDVFGVNLRPILEPQELDATVASLRSVLEDNALLTSEVDDDLEEAHARAAEASGEWPSVPEARFGGMLEHVHLHVHLQEAEGGGWFYTISLVRPEYAGPDAPDLQDGTGD